MSNLEKYIHEDDGVDGFIKLAVVHHQFESIHPFYDGNGRTGRILNVLLLVLYKDLNLPILYLSRYITQHKGEYYRLLQSVRDHGEWGNVDSIHATLYREYSAGNRRADPEDYRSYAKI